MVGGTVFEMGVTTADHLLRGTRNHRLGTAADAAGDSAVPDRADLATEASGRVRGSPRQ